LKKLFFLGPHLRQFIAQARQTHLFIHVFILPRSDIFCTQFSVRCCPRFQKFCVLQDSALKFRIKNLFALKHYFGHPFYLLFYHTRTPTRTGLKKGVTGYHSLRVTPRQNP
ncbi:hypothetical protein, partial [Intestinimonas sp.]|uniref:hypothetical protein n=1 Tax=Intestinimonas sp. TaxID=1965293 RepID=UPI003AAAC2D5